VRATWRWGAAAGVAVAVGLVAAVHATRGAPPTPAPRHVIALGVYAGPGAKGVSGAAVFDEATGQRSTVVLDFAPAGSWAGIEGQPWLLRPHARDPGTRLVYALPVVPQIPGATLAACAQGRDDGHWTTLATNLVRSGLADTIVRPGWEPNGDWYPWSAAGRAADYVSCFRHVVTAMRAVPGQRLRFSWDVTAGPTPMDATLAWPGRDVVDYVGVDAYDVLYTGGDGGEPTDAERRAAVDALVTGPRGLRYWAGFAARQGRRLAVPEWGLTWRADGPGGGDDVAYVRAMFGFFASADVAYAVYFESSDATTDHRLAGATRFPEARATYADALRALVG
jgi:hypothetical protein